MPKNRRPPESIWDNAAELEIWIDNLSEGESNTAEFTIPEWEIEN